uniref:Adenylosuccinate synthetase n=1 Tax=Panagrolaimus sp. JU765 TaxID=591449 RepID=A0AC34Q0M0_9BILA
MSEIPNGWAASQGSPVTVILGAQWGDEGKGKIIDFLIQHNQVDVTARCQGGNNAGHTVVANGKKYDFHLLPSGMISERCSNVIGNGVVVNLDSFFHELEHNGILTDQPGWEKRIFISNRAHLVLRVHSQVDGRQEDSLQTKNKIGTTNKGIGPTYSSKCFRNGIRVADLIGDFDDFTARYKSIVAHYRKQFPTIEIDEEDELVHFKKHAEHLRELNIVADTSVYLHQARLQGKKVLVEGANGALLDIDFGTYPYVTSSNATVGGVCTGLGIPPTAIKEVIGVVKAYQTRVGAGPFPTEQFNEDGERLQEIGCEVGVTTGRKRRCGWIDLVLLRSATLINGFTAFAFTKLDVLDSFAEVKVAVGYKLDGENMDFPPAKAADWDRIDVEYKTFPGWQTITSEIREYDDLPQACKDYIHFVEEFVGVPIKYIGFSFSPFLFDVCIFCLRPKLSLNFPSSVFESVFVCFYGKILLLLKLGFRQIGR